MRVRGEALTLDESTWTLQTAKLWIMREVSFGRNKVRNKEYLVDDLIKEQKLAWTQHLTLRLTSYGKLNLEAEAAKIGWSVGDRNL